MTTTETSPLILIVEDNPSVTEALTLFLDIHGFNTITAQGPKTAEKVILDYPVDLVIQDMNFKTHITSGAEGQNLFYLLRQHRPDLPIILMTAWANLEMAVELVKAGAADYINKPWDDNKLLVIINNLLSIQRLTQENSRLKQLEKQQTALKTQTETKHDLCGTVFLSPLMHRVVDIAIQVAPADVPVLITGPNGSGKEKITEIIQANSRRSDKPFVKVNVGALPEDLLESELFGAEKGAFTGSDKRRIGRFEAANGGTLFLDEIGNLPLSGQQKLLRVLQTGEFERLGSSSTQTVDVRVIAATNENLKQAIAEQRFREDLFYRLNVIEISIPPLHQRPEDIIPLASRFLQTADTSANKVIGQDAIEGMQAYSWPGNVRELQNSIQRACLLSQSEIIHLDDLGLNTAGFGDASGIQEAFFSKTESKDSQTNHSELKAIESRQTDSKHDEFIENTSMETKKTVNAADIPIEEIQRVIDQHGGVIARAARQLGISRQALYRRLAKHTE